MTRPFSKVVPNQRTNGVSDYDSRLIWQVALACLFLSAVGLLTSNPVITCAGFLLLPVLWRLLWRPGEPAVLLFCALFQWTQAFTPVLSADIEGRTLTEVFGGPQLEWAAWASLGSVLVLSIGMNTVGMVFQSLKVNPKAMRSQASNMNTARLVILYIALQVFSVAITYASTYAGGLRQPLLAFANIKWISVIVLAWATLQDRKNPTMLGLVVMLEVVLGFTGYFSDFKSIVFVLFLVSLGVAVERGKFRILPIGISILLILPLVGFWQAIKSDYRNYLNQGTGKQAELVSYTDRFGYLYRSIEKIEIKGIADGVSSAFERIGYLEYFALTLKNVPSRIPHEDGGLWIGAINHVLLPRLFFPNKAVVNDAERTNFYTLAYVAGHAQGTEVSLGYPAESYIDFGFIGMFVPIFFLGVLFGWTYNWFSSRGPHFILGNALGTSLLLFSGHQLEMSSIKIIGGLVVSIIAYAIVQRFAVPWMGKFCTQGNMIR